MIPHVSARLRRSFLATAALVALSGITTVNAAPVNPDQVQTGGTSFVTLAPAMTINPQDAIDGALPATQPLHLVISLKLRNQAALDSFIASATRPGTPEADRTMAEGRFAAQHAPTPAQAQSVAGFLAQAGFNHVAIAPNRLLVSADGTAGAAEVAFNTSLARITTADGRQAFANTEPVQIPATLQGIVLAVLGLQDVYRPHVVAQAAPLSISGHNPVDFSAIYSGTGVPTAAGVPVGILTEGNLAPSIADLNTFTSTNGLATVTTQTVNTNGTSSDTSGQIEWDLDSQDIVGMGGGEVGELIFYNMPSLQNTELITAFNRAVTDNATKILNVSLGECETDALQDGSAAAADVIFQVAITNGQTFSVSTGDSGADECGDGLTTPSWPANSQYVVAVGGTTLSTSGTTYTSESAWSGGGGSPSLYEPQPSWQSGIVPGNKRGLPDVAFDGDPSSGARIYVGNGIQQWGGTSLSSPLFVGSWARMLAAHGTGLGFAAPILYLTLTAVDYHDVTTGSNGGETAGPGWDFTTGFGSFILNMVNQHVVAGPVAPSVAKTFAPATVGSGESSTLTITLNNSSQPGAATLSGALTDTFPSDLVIAAQPNAATTCSSGSVTATPGAGSVALNSGAQIPAGGTCTITVDVTGADGTYVNTIPAGALTTDLGDNGYAATANLQIGYVFPQPYCNVTFPSGVQPISHVTFAGIDNPSSPGGGTPALENFTSIFGDVAPGQTASMAVQGNTEGNFTNVITAYVDWNQNGVFTDPGETYTIGTLHGSTGADGQQAIANIAVPAGALPGNTRMRVTKRYSAAADSCNSTGYGQAEDYTLTVSSGGGPIPPTIAKSFTPASVAVNTDSTAIITLSNANATAATLSADLVDTLPSGLVASAASTTCGGSASFTSGTITLTSGATIPTAGSCTITATVQAATAGSYVNTIAAGALQTDQGDNAAAASATLTVTGGTPTPPTIAKSFTPASVEVNADSTAVITLSNANATAATLSADLVDTLPTGLVASAASTTCGGSASFTPGTVTLTSGATIPATGSCAISATVQAATAGSYVNTIAAGALQTDQGDNATAASATLTVTTNPIDEIFTDGFDGTP